jgi:hypothetical protein
MVVVTDKGFKPYAKKYAQDQEAFFNDFSKAFGKLIELGVPQEQVRVCAMSTFCFSLLTKDMIAVFIVHCSSSDVEDDVGAGRGKGPEEAVDAKLDIINIVLKETKICPIHYVQPVDRGPDPGRRSKSHEIGFFVVRPFVVTTDNNHVRPIQVGDCPRPGDRRCVAPGTAVRTQPRRCTKVPQRVLYRLCDRIVVSQPHPK